MSRIRKVLIANRGEVAIRIARTCRELGIRTVAVFSDADADTPHVEAADESVRIGPAESARSYLDFDKVIGAAKLTGADAIHPGFGFLAENGDFAERCSEEGITFIGPSPEAIRVMGSKQEAKGIAEDAGVPVVSGYRGDDQSVERIAQEVANVGFPCLIKAAAGGGGKGMRIVREKSEVEDAVLSARREAEKSFSDGTLLVERYVERPRHVEVQILGDSHGNVVHLFDRDCSVQRRHQKVIEEAPAPNLPDDVRESMLGAAVSLAKAIKYESAGTVEFIVDPQGAFYFLEMNTRLQVEHPVTEEVTGIDIVAEQIRIANGDPISFSQDDVRVEGASIECRIYAEDPENDFLPASGRIERWSAPEKHARVESGIRSGAQISVNYDPMLAKLVTTGRDRDEALGKMRHALDELVAHGPPSNIGFLKDVVETDVFAAGEATTHFIAEQYPEGWSSELDEETVKRASFAAALFIQQGRASERRILPGMRSGFRNSRFAPERLELDHAGEEADVFYIDEGDGIFTIISGEERLKYRVAARDECGVVIEDDRMLQRRFEVTTTDDHIWVQGGGQCVRFSRRERLPLPGTEVPDGGSTAPMNGAVIEVRVEEGHDVEKGAVLVVIEAMKMEHSITADTTGVVREVRVKAGAQVSTGDVLVVIDSDDDDEA